MATTKVKSEKLKVKSEGEKPPETQKKSSKTASTMEELLAKTGYALKGMKKGDTITGTITRMTAKEIALDIGGKTEGIVMDRELESYKDMLSHLQPGDTVTAQVVIAENDRGQSVLSIRKSLLKKRWQRLADAQKGNEPVEVILKEQVRGGILVDYGGIRGYVPLSQLDGSLSKQVDKITGRTIQVKVIEVDVDTNRLVFSQRALTEEATLSKQKELLDAIPVDSSIETTITGVAPFGAFAKFSIEKDGEKHDVEGLIHISEIAWEKVDDPNQYLKTGDKIKVKIIGVEKNSGKITLSVKQLLPDPWEHVLDQFEKDSQVKGTVTRTTPYGMFVELTPGVEGLIHISKIIPGTEPAVGDEIVCIVEDIKPDQRKISLSMALTEKPIGYR